MAVVTAIHQQDWLAHVPLVLIAYRTAAQDSIACSPALLMLGREIGTQVEMVVGRPPDASLETRCREYARKLQDRLESTHEFASDKSSGFSTFYWRLLWYFGDLHESMYRSPAVAVFSEQRVLLQAPPQLQNSHWRSQPLASRGSQGRSREETLTPPCPGSK